MMPGLNQIYFCSKCRNLVTRGSIRSGNTINALSYSDGKQIVPMLPQFPQITKCRKCDHIFWLNFVNWLGCDNRSDKKKRLNKLDPAEFLSVADYRVALQNGLGENKNQELLLRKLLWWAYNDRYRKGGRPSIYEQDQDSFDRFMFKDPEDVFTNHQDEIFDDAEDRRRWEENCQHLKTLVDRSYLEERIMYAELERNLGNFEACENILGEIFLPELGKAKTKMLDACQKKHRWVIRL